jgi:hypothetical protein
MTRFLAVLVLALAGNAWSQTLFYDSFVGASIDPLKWNVVNPFVGSGPERSSVTPFTSGQFARSMNRGTLVPLQDYTSPYLVSGIFRTASLFDIASIDLRTDGQLNPNNIYGGFNGLSVTFWSPANYWGVGGIHVYRSDGSEPFASTYARSFAPNIEYTFSILDTGDALTINVEGSDMSPFEWVVPTSFSAGSKIGFGSRHYHMGQTGVTDFLEVQVSVPEPSSLSLLLVGGLVALARRKRA